MLQEQYVNTGDVKWVVVPFALQSQAGVFPTMPSATAALCANEQDAFAEYHEALFSIQASTDYNTEAGFLAIASALDMNVDAFSSCLNDNDYADIILENITMAQQAGVSSTPSFFFDGELLPGNQPISVFQQRLDSLLGS